MITVKELIARLAELDPEAVVIMQRDPEGNGYAPCAGAEGNGAWDGDEQEYGYASLSPGLEKNGYSEEDLVSGVPAVVLWPQ
jgi:hypothetical protein